jgi:hypothetical protein
MWQEERDGQLIWRASLETPGQDKRLAFADLATLFAFLKAQTEADAPGRESDEMFE